MNKSNDKDKLTELRATLPAPLEDNSDTTWREFQALQSSQEQQFESTQPLTNAAPLAPKAGAARGRPAVKAVTLDQAMQLARLANRVCPLPPHWKAMFELLQAAVPGGVPPLVIDGAAWNAIPPMQKRLRLREQLEWAERYRVLEPAYRFLQQLPEDGWLHF